MRILLLCHAFNSLSQRLYCELAARGHELSVELDIADQVTEEAVALFRPELVLAPYLKRAIPESIWRCYVCLVVHPGIVGDRGPSALDWAIQASDREWGVTIIQATGEIDGGPVWASAAFPMRRASKSSLYRHEVGEAATRAVLEAVERFTGGAFVPSPVDPADPQIHGRQRPAMRQADRAIDWQREATATIVARINAADGSPGVVDEICGETCRLYDAWPEDRPHAGAPGEVIARRETAVLRRTIDGALWIGHLKREAAGAIKLPATVALGSRLDGLRELPLGDSPETCLAPAGHTWQDIRCEEAGGVAFLHFEFYNGAMSTHRCRRLLAAFEWVRQRPVSVIVLMGGRDFWSNGIDLASIEAAESPPDESWANINAIDDLAEAIIRCDDRLTIAAVQGNCAAGGCFLARASDFVWARAGTVLNPHYRNMGNLFGSEYWTYLLPARIGWEAATRLMRDRLPMSAADAVDRGLIDACLGGSPEDFRIDVARRAAELGGSPDLAGRLHARRARRLADELEKPLASYRATELAEMARSFYGFDPSYHVARFHFVHKTPHSWTPRHLAKHREIGWTPP